MTNPTRAQRTSALTELLDKARTSPPKPAGACPTCGHTPAPAPAPAPAAETDPEAGED